MCVHDVPENITLVLVSSHFTVHPVSRIVCSPAYSWMYSLVHTQCIVYTLVYGIQSSVHSLSSTVYIPVYWCTSMYSPMYGPLYSVHSRVQLEHSWHTVKCTSGHIWCTVHRHISVYTVQCKVRVCPVYIPMEQSDVQPRIHQCMSSVYPCTVPCTVCACLFHIYKILWIALTVILTRNGKEQIMNRSKEEREKGTKFRQIENWIAWHWIQVSGVPELSRCPTQAVFKTSGILPADY